MVCGEPLPQRHRYMPEEPVVPSAPSRITAAAVLLTGGALLTGCGTPPELREPPERAFSSPHRSATAPAPPPPRPAAPTMTGPPPTAAFGESTATRCDGHPGSAQVIALLRRSTELLPRSATVSVPVGPLCAGTWQYTVLSVPNREPLQVVTKGEPAALTLVTAGTDVCSSIPVRVTAPAGIRIAASC